MSTDAGDFEAAATEPAVAAADGPPTPGIRPFSLRNSLLTYGTNIGTSILALVNVLIMARALGPAGRGDVAFLTTVAGMSGQIALLGVQRAVSNLAAREPRRGPSLATNSVALALVLGGVAISAVALLVALVPAAGAHEPLGRRWLALGSIPVVILQSCLMQLVRAYDDHGRANLAWLLIPSATALGNGALAATGNLTPTAAVAFWVAGQALSTLLLLVVLIRRHRGFGRLDGGLVKGMLGFGLKTHASQVMLLTNYRLDQWLLGAMRGSRELGIYSVAVAWSEALFFLPTAMEQVQRPDLARGTPAQVAWRSSRVFRTCLVLTLMLTLVMWLLAPFLCVTVFGAAFRRSVPQLRILALGCFGISALKLLGDTLTAQRKPLSEMAAISVSFVSIVALDLILIPAHGGIGASLGSTLAYSAGGLAVLAIFVRKLPARLRDLVPRRSDLRWLIERLRPASSR
jgi:O-antigen/teichoic acid export membrane protein